MEIVRFIFVWPHLPHYAYADSDGSMRAILSTFQEINPKITLNLPCSTECYFIDPTTLPMPTLIVTCGESMRDILNGFEKLNKKIVPDRFLKMWRCGPSLNKSLDIVATCLCALWLLHQLAAKHNKMVLNLQPTMLESQPISWSCNLTCLPIEPFHPTELTTLQNP